MISGSAQNCSTPVSSVIFQQKYSQMATKPNDQIKLSFGNGFISSKCLTSQQVQLMASLFMSDGYRLEFCKTAYTRTLDPINFYDVYDAFASFSAAFRLHDHVNGISNSNNTVVEVVEEIEEEELDPNRPVTVTFPNLSYPSYVGYKGETNCDMPMADSDFKVIVEELFRTNNDNEIATRAKDIADEHCVSMAQMMKMASVIKMEGKRLTAMKDMFYSTYDMANYASAKAALSHIPYQQNWVQYCESELEINQEVEEVAVAPCVTSDGSYAKMIANIKKESFDDDKLVIVNQICNSNCLSVHQIKGIMKQFTFGEKQVQVAKKAYSKCSDPGNYYQLGGVFTFNSDKQMFNDWLNKQ